MMNNPWKKTNEVLPPEGKYVIGKHNRGTWIDKDDQKNVNTVIVKLVKGLSENDRQKMELGELPDSEAEPSWCLSEGWQTHMRSDIYMSEDEYGNNQVPYNWKSFGPDSFFGQTITHWMEIPDIQ